MPQLRQPREPVFFTYMGKSYSGYIISSTDIEPRFHWFLFDDVDLVRTISDSIAFKEDAGRLVPVHNYSRHAELVRAVKKAVEAYLLASRHVEAS